MRRIVKNALASPSTAVDPQAAMAAGQVIAAVRERGDEAVRAYSQKFDGFNPESFRLASEQIVDAVGRVDPQTIADIREAQDNIRRFAQRQRASLSDFEEQVRPGVVLGQRSIPVGSVGAYVPGGRYPLLASAHMTVVTAKVAGVDRVIACTPAFAGCVPDATVAALHLAGADDIYLLGGAQAVAAMALGTQSIDRVDMVVGPGNAFVTEAKRQLFGEIGIDLLAGPTEVLVIADDSADAVWVATDLLSQAEHGPDSPAVLITTSDQLATAVLTAVEELLVDLPTADVAGAAWRDHGQILVVDDLAEAFALADEYASEHVEVLTQEPRRALETMRNYGALFLGERTCVSFGDKVIGTNHVLPTRRAARFTGGLWVGMFLKTVTFQEVISDDASIHLGELCGRAARVENFEGHARSADLRAAGTDDRRPTRAQSAAR